MKPTEDTLSQVQEWLQDCGVARHQLKYSSAQDWIKVTLPVEDVEKLLDTQYSVFKHSDGAHIVRTSEWSLPLHLHQHIETIQPTNSFFSPKTQRSTVKQVLVAGLDLDLSAKAFDAPNKATVDTACNITAVTPTCLRTLYGEYNFNIPRSGTKFSARNYRLRTQIDW